MIRQHNRTDDDTHTPIYLLKCIEIVIKKSYKNGTYSVHIYLTYTIVFLLKWKISKTNIKEVIKIKHIGLYFIYNITLIRLHYL